MEKKHIPVLVQEVIEQLHIVDGGVYIDATFGAGGHTQALLLSNPTISIIALDWDKKSIEKFGPNLEEQFKERLRIMWSNFSLIDRVLKKLHIKEVDGIIADFGTSLMHFKEREGFSFLVNTPLDMRMSPAHQKITAAQILNEASVDELTTILNRGGEIQFAYKIAKEIVDWRKKYPLERTQDLVNIVEKVIGKNYKKIHGATKTFQALRIAVNKEIENIHAFLINAIPFLKQHGRIACISFHSLEDAKVKELYQQYERMHILKMVHKKPIVPTPEEIVENPSSRSAKLRIAEKISATLTI